MQRDPNDTYEMRVFMAAAEVDSLFEELEHTLLLFARAHSFPELTALLKLYVISWHSLSDLVAIVLNEAYNLGVSAQDVSFGSVLRNRHIMATAIPEIINRHSKTTRYEHFVRMRNDIVHRGRLKDDELLTIHSDLLTNLVGRSSVEMINDEEAKRMALEAARSETGMIVRIRELIGNRKREYAEHLAETRAFLAEIADVVGPHVRDHPV
jgi:hypothetical protein